MSKFPEREITDLIRQEHLPEDYAATVQKYYAPLAEKLADRQTELAKTIVIGVNGPQGSGKSTVAKFLALLLRSAHDKRVAVFSLDDIYLTRAEREKLARDVHPLLITRGVPGTHDVKLGRSVIQNLINAEPNDITLILRFDKAQDDRRPREEWDAYKGAPDIIIFEGWCVGATSQPESVLSDPINELERLEDSGGNWRRYVNDAIAQYDQSLFDQIDVLVYLKPPNFECVFEWRQRQEEKLAENAISDKSHIMDAEELKRFISHYERLTRHMMETLPARADVVIALDEEQRVVNVG